MTDSSTPAAKSKIYFPGLNGIRAIAAVIVVLGHCRQFQSLFGFEKGPYSDMPGFAVTLFFVLSGFLITYLLLREREQCGSIGIPQFYVRRILRIWPIYYLAIALCLLYLAVTKSFPYSPQVVGASLACYIFMLPNVAYALNMAIPPITPLWSVGVEEQFYAFWPLLLQRFKNVVAMLIGVIVVCLLLKIGFRVLHLPALSSYLTQSRFDCMAIGGLGACWVFGGMRHKQLVFSPLVQCLAWAWLVWSVLTAPIHIVSLFDHELHAVVYIALILNVSCNPKPLLSLEHTVLDWLGKISYGIYVYHMLVLFFLGSLLNGKIPQGWLGIAMVYLLVCGTTLAIAHLSYTHFEQRFLHLKERFTRIASRSSRYAQ